MDTAKCLLGVRSEHDVRVQLNRRIGNDWLVEIPTDHAERSAKGMVHGVKEIGRRKETGFTNLGKIS